MTWAAFVDTDGKPKVDFYAFCRGKGLISEHEKRADAEKALKEYLEKAKAEAARGDGQRELPL